MLIKKKMKQHPSSISKLSGSSDALSGALSVELRPKKETAPKTVENNPKGVIEAQQLLAVVAAKVIVRKRMENQ